MMKKIKRSFKRLIKKLNLPKSLSTRGGFYLLLIALFWLKSEFAYFVDFKMLQVQTPFQFLIMLINPLASGALLLGIAFFFKRRGGFYTTLGIVYIGLTILLYVNAIYYREFSQFVTVNTMLSFFSANQGVAGSSAQLLSFTDIFYFIDFIILGWALLTKRIHLAEKRVPRQTAILGGSLAFLLLLFNIVLSDMSRPQLLTRQFDNTYMVKYLGINTFTVQDALSTYNLYKARQSAKPQDVDVIKKFTQTNFAPANPKYYGLAKGKNVFVIHLESFQQFLINQKINDKEVTPYLNSLYNSKHTIAFDNFFHEVGQGKTSDAENMLENGTYGLRTGSLFARNGSDQTFQSAPAILNQRAHYSTSVFHGNVGTFWNRSMAYKNMGFQNFFDASFFDVSGNKSSQWGLKDKLLFRDSVPYLEQLQQPFYAKYITVTNHFPFELDDMDKDPNFQTTDSGSEKIDGYFETAHYLDQSIQEFFTYLKKVGLYNKSIFIIYGDHYGISNSDNPELASVLGMKNAEDWDDFDNAQMQRVPYMIVMPKYNKGHIDHTYGGEIDALPTLEHLLGISTKRYIQFGQDLLSTKHQQLVVFRNKDFITKHYSYIDNVLYDNKTGEAIDKDDMSDQLAKQLKKWKKTADDRLTYSDLLNNKNLLRFYTPKGFSPIDASKFNYSPFVTKRRLKQQQDNLGVRSTSILSQRDGRTTIDDYHTDAPEAHDKPSASTRLKVVNPDDTNADKK